MAVRDDFTAGEVLAAADLNDTFASKLSYSYGTATPSTSVDGFLWYDENETPPVAKFWDGAAFQILSGGGKILQVVRATDTTNRSTTSTSYVDVPGLSVTVTPSDTSSAILLVVTGFFNATSNQMNAQITDSSNNAISGAENFNYLGTFSYLNIWAYATPATTSAVTYKFRWRQSSGVTINMYNGDNTGQMFAIEVGA